MTRPTRTFDLDGKVALVTGAGDGIGRATARLLADRGAKVAVLDRDATTAKKSAIEVGEHRALPIAVDVTDRDGMAHAVAQTVEQLGRLDLVVANAGITPRPATLRHLEPEEFDRVIAVNLTGVLNTVRPAIPQLVEHGGHVVVSGSCAAFSPPIGGASYMISKAGVEVLARAFRLELAPHGVGVSTVLFGIVETGLARATLDHDPIGAEIQALLPWPLNRRLPVEDAAAAVVRAVEQRRGLVIAPAWWAPLYLARGVTVPLLDAALVRSRSVHQMLARLEDRTSQGVR